MKHLSFLTLITCLNLISCASVETKQSQARLESLSTSKNTAVQYPDFQGAKMEVQVLRYGIPQEIIDKYPELGDKRIGWGLYNRLLDELYETNRFKFVEEKSAIQSKILSNWALSQSGAAVELEETPGQDSPDLLKTPKYLLYAEVFEFSVSSQEEIQGIQSNQENTTWIGVQIRMVNSNDGSFTPASGQGSASTQGQGVLLAPNMQFDQSTIGMATEQATENAVLKLIQRMR